MIFKYGTYTHDQSEVSVRAAYTSIFDQFQRRIGEKIRFTCLGVKRAASQTALTTALVDLFDAYQVDYQDFGLYLDDGTTPTVMAVLNSATFGGTKVIVPPSQINGPWSGQPEYANQKTYYFVLEAQTRVGDGLYAYKERLTTRGTGGSKWRYSPQISGAPQLQILQSATTFWYVQEGRAVGHNDYVAPNLPLFPGIEHAEMREVTYESPEEVVVGGQRLFTTEWRYFMEATTAAGFTAFDVPSIT